MGNTSFCCICVLGFRISVGCLFYDIVIMKLALCRVLKLRDFLGSALLAVKLVSRAFLLLCVATFCNGQLIFHVLSIKISADHCTTY